MDRGAFRETNLRKVTFEGFGNQILRISAIVVIALIFVPVGAVRSQTLDTTFQGNIQSGGNARVSAVQADGKILIGGGFTYINNTVKNGILRLNADGTLDPTFDSGSGTLRTNNPTTAGMSAIAVQPDGKILIGGFFDLYNGVSRNRIARLNPDGSVDTSFDVGSGSATINTIVLQSDGKILIGGDFFSYNGTTVQSRILRLNSDGTNDASFNPTGTAADNSVYAIAVQADGKIVIGGDFLNSDGNPRSRIARLNANGTYDPTFNNGIGAAARVSAIALQSSGKIVIGGSFLTVNGSSFNRLARLNTDASIDTTFASISGANGGVTTVNVLADSSIFISGGFTSYDEIGLKGLARLTADGTVDPSFTTGAGAGGASATVTLLAIQATKIYVGGSFSSYSGVPRSGVVRLNTNGSLDSGFTSNLFLNTNGATGPETITVQSGGKILIGGTFAGYDGVVRNGIARLNSNGSLDTTFDPGTGGDSYQIKNIVAQPDGKILIAGFFETFNGQSRKYLARLNADGSIDASFTTGTGPNSTIKTIVLQPDNKILVGGTFTSYNGAEAKYLMRLNSDGTLDSSLNTGMGPNSFVYAVALQPDGKIIVGGILTGYNGTIVNGIIRINANGSLEETFVPNLSMFPVSISLILLQPDGKILISGALNSGYPGNFTRLNADGTPDTTFGIGTGPNSPITAMALQAGKILLAGYFTTFNGTPRKYIARIDLAGSLDSYNSCISGANGFVTSIALPVGHVLLGGTFTTFNGVERHGIAQIATDFTGSCQPTTPFDFDGDGHADVSVFRPSQGNWYIQYSQSSSGTTRFGLQTDRLAPADYDGDGKADIAVWRDEPSNPDKANFYILQSSNGAFRVEQFGRTGDLPTVVGDWDGDGKDDLAIYRNGASGGQSRFYYRPSSVAGADFSIIPWGVDGDRPVHGDFDGDGKLDAAVFRPSDATWYILKSSNLQPVYDRWGLGTDLPVPTDYDGDRRADIAVFRNGVWYIKQSSNNSIRYETFGLAGDTLAPADYDGDGKADIAVVRNSIWYINGSAGSTSYVNYGISGDVTVPNSYIAP
ncbi:hypothetical protein BH10ACI3_BH10ACI3_04270 [soil metagenome]